MKSTEPTSEHPMLREARELFPFSQAIRRDLHRHPELGFQEVRTAGIIARELTEYGLEVSTGIGKTGVVGVLEGDPDGPVVLMRFDMDALPILEETGAEYASEDPGKMHGCGHDAHVSIGLTTARMLVAHRSELKGSVKFVFQPAEEGLGGAERMIADGVLENPAPRHTLAMHVWNDRPLGWVAVSPGPVMAGADIFKVKVSGRGGHGAIPELAVDPIYASAQIITALQSIVSRNVPPQKTAVISVTQIKSGEAFNIIPPFAEFQGTIRVFDEDVHRRIVERFNKIIESVAEALECSVEIELRPVTPAVVNDAAITRLVEDVGRVVLPDSVFETDYATMGSEDMSVMMQKVPGCYFFVGCGSAEPGVSYPHHHPKFDIDEDVIPRSAAVMAAAAMRLLNQSSAKR